MKKNKECPECGSKEIGEGKFSGYTKLLPVPDKLFTLGSEVVADVCTECGHIFSLRIKDPKKFK